MVPVPPFNFMSWILGFSDQPDLSCFVKLSDSHSRKTLSICQDLIYISSEGRCPKSFALSMATRQLTRSSKLAKILYGFGHCTSHGGTLTHETDLAKLSMKSEATIPKDITPNKSTCLVFDNDDFNEEARVQTHCWRNNHSERGIICSYINGQRWY